MKVLLLLLLMLTLSNSIQHKNRIFLIVDLKSCEKSLTIPIYILNFLENEDCCKKNQVEFLLKSNREKDTILLKKQYNLKYPVNKYNDNIFMNLNIAKSDNIIVLNNEDSLIFRINTNNKMNIDSLISILKKVLCK